MESALSVARLTNGNAVAKMLEYRITVTRFALFLRLIRLTVRSLIVMRYGADGDDKEGSKLLHGQSLPPARWGGQAGTLRTEKAIARQRSLR